MGLGEVIASHGKDEQAAEDVGEVPAGCGQDKQDPGGASQVPAGYKESRVEPEPPPGFPRQVGPRYYQPIVPLWYWNRNICRRSISAKKYRVYW